eukprot:jgi/Tetstr1/455290/TSEL_042126.t1
MSYPVRTGLRQGCVPVSRLAVPTAGRAAVARPLLRPSPGSRGRSVLPARGRLTLATQASRSDEVTSTKAALERMQAEIAKLQASLDKALGEPGEEVDCSAKDCKEQVTGSAARQAASDHPQAAGVQEDWYLPKAAQESSSEAPVDSQPIKPSAEVAPEGLPDIDVDAAPMPAASPAPVLPPEPPAGLPDIDMETPLSGLPDIDMEASPIPAPETPPTLPPEPPAGLPDIDMDLPPPPQDVYWAPEGSMGGDAADAAVDSTVPKDVYYVPEGNYTGDPSVLRQPSDAVDLDAAAADLDASLAAAVQDVDRMLGGVKAPAAGESLPMDATPSQEAAIPLLSKLQAVLDSLKGKPGGDEDTRLDYAMAQLQEIQRSLQGAADKEAYWVPGGSVEGAAAPAAPPATGEEYWMPEGTSAEPSPGMAKQVEELHESVAKQGYWTPDGTTNVPISSSPADPPTDGDYWMPGGASEGPPAELDELVKSMQERAAKQGYWTPDGTTGAPLSSPADPPLMDPSDRNSLYWVPEGVTPEAGAPLPEATPPAGEASGFEDLESALKDIVDAMELSNPEVPAPESADPGAAGAAGLEDLIEAARNLDVGPEAAPDQLPGAEQAGSLLGSIKVLAAELAARFEESPPFGASGLPIFGKALAYVLAAAGVAYLMMGFLGGRKEEGGEAVEPDAVINSYGERVVDLPKILRQKGKPDATEMNDWLDHSAEDANGTERPAQDSDDSGSPSDPASGAPDGGVQTQTQAKEGLQVLPWMLDEASKSWGGSVDEDLKRPNTSLTVKASYDDSTAVATVVPFGEEDALPKSTASRGVDPRLAAEKADEQAEDIDMLAGRRREARSATSETVAQRAALKDKLWWVVRGLGPTASIVPGGEPIRHDIDKLLSELEDVTPLETPLNTDITGEELPITSISKVPSKAHPDLLGQWRLEYTSNSQVVQRNVMQQVLQMAEAIPGFGVGDVMQQLKADVESDNIVTENTAVFGLGPFGSWQISVTGTWEDNGGGVCAKAFFRSFSVRPVEIMGFPASALPEVRVPVPTELQAEVEWCTTYCDKDFRIGRGTTGNLFVFRKEADSGAKRVHA